MTSQIKDRARSAHDPADLRDTAGRDTAGRDTAGRDTAGRDTDGFGATTDLPPALTELARERAVQNANQRQETVLGVVRQGELRRVVDALTQQRRPGRRARPRCGRPG